MNATFKVMILSLSNLSCEKVAIDSNKAKNVIIVFLLERIKSQNRTDLSVSSFLFNFM